jgi:hypothetical protein
MIKQASKTISYLFHPVLMPLAGILAILAFSHLALLPYDGKAAILWIVSLTTLFFPLAMLPIFYFQKVITGITVSERRERLIPMLSTAGFYYFGYYLMHRYTAPLILQHFLLASFVCLLAATLVHLKWKISIHMIGIGGFIGLLSALSVLYQSQLNGLLMLSILIAGIIGSARLYLEEHNPRQIYTGFTLGYIITSGLILSLNI